jgi:hypothetical protein
MKLITAGSFVTPESAFYVPVYANVYVVCLCAIL